MKRKEKASLKERVKGTATSVASTIKIVRRVNGIVSNKKLFWKVVLLLALTVITSQAWVLDNYLFTQMVNKLMRQKSFLTNVSLVTVASLMLSAHVTVVWLRKILNSVDRFFKRYFIERTHHQYWSSYTRYGLQDRENTEMQHAFINAQKNQDSLQKIFFIEIKIFISIITICSAIAILTAINLWFFVAVVTIVMPRLFFMRKRKIRNEKMQSKVYPSATKHQKTIFKHLESKDAEINSVRNICMNKYQQIRKHLDGIGYRDGRYFDNMNFFINSWYYVVVDIVITLYAAFAVEKGIMSIGSLYLMFTATRQIYHQLIQMTDDITDLEVQTRKAIDIFKIIDGTPAIVDRPDAQPIDNTINPRIEFDNVYFCYPGTQKDILCGVSFIIEPGQSVALIAKNGEGKTTIALLLLRFYDPTAGSIRINGIDLRLIQRESLFSITGAIFQDFDLFSTTIEHAIKMSRQDKNGTSFDVWQALETVGLKEYVQSLPQGIHQKIHKVYKDSIKLSGGQSQKLALAAMVYRNPKLLILDEFTSALDPEAEFEIVEQYKKIAADKTVFIISHRYLSLKIVDTIFVLKNGKIVESGSKKDLLQIQDGFFKKLYLSASKAVQFSES